MKADMDKLRGKMREKRITQEELSLFIGLNPSSFWRKLKSDGLNFSIGQMHKMAERLDLAPQEAIDIFLSQNSH